MSVGCYRDEEQMKMKMREGGREKWNERDKPDCQDLQKHLKEGRRDCWNKGKKESDAKVCVDGMKKESIKTV